MPDPIALQIMRAVVERLETIAVAGGFHTNAGALVSVGWLHPDPPTLALSVHGGAEDAGQDTNKSRVNARLNLIVTARVPVPAGDTEAALLEKVIADVQAAVEDPDDRNMGNLAQLGINYKGRETITPPPGSPVAWGYLKYAVGYHRKYGDPATRA